MSQISLISISCLNVTIALSYAFSIRFIYLFITRILAAEKTKTHINFLCILAEVRKFIIFLKTKETIQIRLYSHKKSIARNPFLQYNNDRQGKNKKRLYIKKLYSQRTLRLLTPAFQLITKNSTRDFETYFIRNNAENPIRCSIKLGHIVFRSLKSYKDWHVSLYLNVNSIVYSIRCVFVIAKVLKQAPYGQNESEVRSFDDILCVSDFFIGILCFLFCHKSWGHWL